MGVDEWIYRMAVDLHIYIGVHLSTGPGPIITQKVTLNVT